MAVQLKKDVQRLQLQDSDSLVGLVRKEFGWSQIREVTPMHPQVDIPLIHPWQIAKNLGGIRSVK